jgi:hypothetical protein
MRFPDWVEAQEKGALKRIERETGVGYTTLMRLRAGEAISRYDVAEKISKATGGAVSIQEICKAPKPARSRRVA